MNSPRPAYLEAHSALNWQLLTCSLFAPAAAEFACLLLGVAGNQPWFFVIMGWLLVPVMISTALLYRNWPTGIRIDESAIGIGAVGSARAAHRTPTASHQSWRLFTCPWPAVEGVRIVTDRAELRHMKNSPRYYTLTNRWGSRPAMSHCNIGVLASPFMRAALVIDINPVAVTASGIRPARFYSNFTDGRFSRLVHPRLSPAWVVPTRHPGALSAALQALPVAPIRLTVMSPRKTRRPRPAAPAAPLGPERTEEWPDGDWVLRPVPGAAAVKVYRCPGCDQEIYPGTAHVVVWPAHAGVTSRRHWHTVCWRRRMQRRPG